MCAILPIQLCQVHVCMSFWRIWTRGCYSHQQNQWWCHLKSHLAPHASEATQVAPGGSHKLSIINSKKSSSETRLPRIASSSWMRRNSVTWTAISYSVQCSCSEELDCFRSRSRPRCRIEPLLMFHRPRVPACCAHVHTVQRYISNRYTPAFGVFSSHQVCGFHPWWARYFCRSVPVYLNSFLLVDLFGCSDLTRSFQLVVFVVCGFLAILLTRYISTSFLWFCSYDVMNELFTS